MKSFRIKIILSLIGLSMVCYALGAYNSHNILIDSFEDVMMARSADGFARDALDYYKTYGSWERGVATEPFEAFRQRKGFPPPPPAHAPPPGFLLTDLDGKVWIRTSSAIQEYSIGSIIPKAQLQAAISIKDLNEIVGYTIPIGDLLPSEIEDQYLQSVTNSWWLSLLVVAAVAIPFGLFLGNRLAGPINDLIRAISAMGPTTMRQKVLVKSNDELGQLSRSFNTMSEDMADFVQVIKSQRETIIETEDALRHGLVNISHELRTPLNTSVSQAQAMLDGVRTLDKPQMQKLANSLNYLTDLVDDLYQLSLADVEAAHDDSALIDLASLLKRCISVMDENFLHKNFKLDVSVPDELSVHGDAKRLRQIIENLLINCHRYSDQGAEIRISLREHNESAELVVSDSGPGVPSESLNFLFDRFYRVDGSRSRATGGTGLGLSLVKSYAEIHGGTAEAFLSEQGGLGIRVRIPIDA